MGMNPSIELVQMGSTHDEINRIERELDQDAGKSKKAQSSGKASKHHIFDAVVATSELIVWLHLPSFFELARRMSGDYFKC